MDMEYEFDASYSEWNTRLESRLSKISELKQNIKELDNKIKDTCKDI
jgi:peptidoglycan hydrolase CwlO-like protein